jgi:hypothetical protein
MLQSRLTVAGEMSSARWSPSLQARISALMSFVLSLLALFAAAIDYTAGYTSRNLRIAVSKSARILRLLG